MMCCWACGRSSRIIELAVIRKAYWITEQAMIDAMTTACEGMPEWQIEAAAHITMKRLGAEGTSYPIWVCSGPNTRQSLCRSTDRRIRRNELVQLTFGAKYMGYCGNMCRPFAIGAAPPRARELMAVALEGVNGALRDIRPGVPAKDVFQNYHDTLIALRFRGIHTLRPGARDRHIRGGGIVAGRWQRDHHPSQHAIQRRRMAQRRRIRHAL